MSKIRDHVGEILAPDWFARVMVLVIGRVLHVLFRNINDHACRG